MLVVGVTGGIGSGKSTFAALLAERGARVVDADELGRRALAPGEPGWTAVLEHFGADIADEGTREIDRPRVAARVFADPNELAALNAIVHPAIVKGIADAIEQARGTEDVVVIDAALIVELGLADSLDVLIAVAASEDMRKKRLSEGRDMTLEDIEARMASQSDPAVAVERADIVVTNDGDMETLAREADRVWAELRARSR